MLGRICLVFAKEMDNKRNLYIYTITVGFMEKVSLIPIIGILCISLVMPPWDITKAQTDPSLLPAAPNVMYMNDEAVDAYKANMMNYSRLGVDVGNVSDI